MLMQTSWSQLLAPRSVLQSIKGKGDCLQASVRSQEFELAILAPTVLWLLSQLEWWICVPSYFCWVACPYVTSQNELAPREGFRILRSAHASGIIWDHHLSLWRRLQAWGYLSPLYPGLLSHLQLTTKRMGNSELLLVGTDRKWALLLPQVFRLLGFPLLYPVLKLLQAFLWARNELGSTDFQCFLIGRKKRFYFLREGRPRKITSTHPSDLLNGSQSRAQQTSAGKSHSVNPCHHLPPVIMCKDGMGTLMKSWWRSVPASSTEPTAAGPNNN